MDKVWVVTCFEYTKDDCGAFGVEAVTDTAKSAAEILEDLFHRKCDIYGVHELHSREYYREGEGFRLCSDGQRFNCIGSIRGIEMTRTAEFPVAYVMREDIEQKGFSTEGLTNERMEEVANRMSKYISDEMEYWYALEAACDWCGISRKEEDDEDD